MEEDGKLPLKRVELSLTKFNEVAIPHHLDLLRQHKANIIKYEEGGQWARVRSEQTHARRVAAQLRALLAELDALRRQVRAPDVTRFDALTQRSRDLTLRAIMDYLGVIERSCIALVQAGSARRPESSPMSMSRASEERSVAGSALSTDSVGVVAHHPHPPEPEHIQLQIDDREVSLREREAVLRGWSSLQSEVRALHDAWQHMQAAALAQRDQVTAAAASVEVAADNVQEARINLALAERIKCGGWGVAGAAAGAAVLGPAGALLGLKAGAAAALAGSALGYLGAAVLGRRRRRQLDGAAAAHAAPPQEEEKKDR